MLKRWLRPTPRCEIKYFRYIASTPHIIIATGKIANDTRTMQIHEKPN